MCRLNRQRWRNPSCARELDGGSEKSRYWLDEGGEKYSATAPRIMSREEGIITPRAFILEKKRNEWWGEAQKKLPRLLGLAVVASLVYACMFILTSHPCWQLSDCWSSVVIGHGNFSPSALHFHQTQPEFATSLANIAFGIAASADKWSNRQQYVKLWWRPENNMRGFVWLDRPIQAKSDDSLPSIRVSADTSRFNYTWRGGGAGGQRSAIRISRIVSETFRQGLPDVHWFVMGDDDTVFFPDNLVKVLQKYDHRKFFYIGCNSESQKQNTLHSFGMAFGGGGYAISYPLAEALEKMQDQCLHRYPHVYGSDSRIQACTAELGVPLTREPGFHQFDLRGNIFGILAAHPVAPLVSLHHIDALAPIFPKKNRVQGLKHLMKASRADPGGILQQSICYDKQRHFTISVSSGYAVQVFKGIHTPLELQKAAMTFIDWKTWRADGDLFTFSVRPLSKDSCQNPSVFYMERVELSSKNKTVITYLKNDLWRQNCSKLIAADSVKVFKQQEDNSWFQAPRRQCCEVLSPTFPFVGKNRLDISVRSCREDEIIAAK